MSAPRVLVTGASGFLDRRLVPGLRAEGDAVCVVGRQSRYDAGRAARELGFAPRRRRMEELPRLLAASEGARV